MTIGERVASGPARWQTPGNSWLTPSAAAEFVPQAMTPRVRALVMRSFVLGVCLGLAGCSRPPVQTTAAQVPSVSVSLPVEREVREHADFTARTAAVESVEV